MPSAAQLDWPQGQPLFEVQWRSISESLGGNGVTNPSDFNVTATGNALEIEVATGDAIYVGTTYTLGSVENHTLSAGDGQDRWDTVYFDTASSSSGVREGTAGSSPEPPDITGDEILLAVIYVPAGASDVGDSNILNWRAQAGNKSENIIYDDATGVYSVTNVNQALDELQEAAQISSYPLGNSDLSNSTITVNAGSGLTTTNASIGLGGSATIAVGTGSITLTELNSPFALPSISDMDVGGNDLEDSGTTIWDTSEGNVPRNQVDRDRNTVTVSGDITTSGEEVFFIDSTAARTVTLASADAVDGREMRFKDETGNATENSITIATEGGETIDGASTITLEKDYKAVTLVSNGTNWYILSEV